MKVTHVEYMGSYVDAGAFPTSVGPEFVFIGRSNVGKSSLINTLVSEKNLARTSNTPGKTRTANFYPVNNAFCFVDVPGYGFAQVSKKERAQWSQLIEQYLAHRKALRGVIHLLDVRHSPSKEDREVSKLLHESKRPVCLVFNKIDKIKRGQVNPKVGSHISALDVADDTAVVPFSADTREGKPAVWAWIEHRLSL